MSKNEAVGFIIGSLALVLAIATLLVFPAIPKVWSVPIVAAVLWREFVLTGMRAELDQFRKAKSP